MKKPFANMIKDLQPLEEVLGISHLDEHTRRETLEKINTRLEDVALRTFIENLSEEEAENFRETLAKGTHVEEEVTLRAQSIPALLQKIEQAVAEEIEKIRKALQ